MRRDHALAILKPLVDEQIVDGDVDPGREGVQRRVVVMVLRDQGLLKP